MSRRDQYLGIDAGGTETKLVLIEDDHILDETAAPALNGFLSEDAAERLAEMINASGATAAAIGLAGLRTAEQTRPLRSKLAHLTTAATFLAEDVEIARRTAFGDACGLVIIAGTGTNAAGITANGNPIRLGGHGYILGDEGGGYWIGRQAAKLAIKSATGLGPKASNLEHAVFAAFGGSPESLERAIYAAPTDRHQLACLVPQIAAQADPVIDSLFDDAADHLISLTRAATKLAGDVPIQALGGIFNVPRIRDRFLRRTPAVLCHDQPALGGARYARDLHRTT